MSEVWTDDLSGLEKHACAQKVMELEAGLCAERQGEYRKDQECLGLKSE